MQYFTLLEACLCVCVSQRRASRHHRLIWQRSKNMVTPVCLPVCRRYCTQRDTAAKKKQKTKQASPKTGIKCLKIHEHKHSHKDQM